MGPALVLHVDRAPRATAGLRRYMGAQSAKSVTIAWRPLSMTLSGPNSSLGLLM